MKQTPVTLAARLAAVHDKVSVAGYGAAGVCLVVIAFSFCYEVVSRYFFNAPTAWATPLVSYNLIAMIFLTLPEITRRAEHIYVNLLIDALSPRHARKLESFVRILAASTCLFAAWFSANETLQQFTQEVWTVPPLAVPKWTVSIWIPYGMLGAATHFLRQLLAGAAGARSRQSAL